MAILAGNIPEWTIADIATIAAGGVGVGIYPTSSPEQCEYIINHSDSEFVFVDSPKQMEKLLQIQNRLPKVKAIIDIDSLAERDRRLERLSTESEERIPTVFPNNSKVILYEDFFQFGKDNLQEFLPKVEEIGYNAKPEDIAIMVYTSGTTGQPKGAMLSHKYILNSCRIAQKFRSDFSR